MKTSNVVLVLLLLVNGIVFLLLLSVFQLIFSSAFVASYMASFLVLLFNLYLLCTRFALIHFLRTCNGLVTYPVGNYRLLNDLIRNYRLVINLFRNSRWVNEPVGTINSCFAHIGVLIFSPSVSNNTGLGLSLPKFLLNTRESGLLSITARCSFLKADQKQSGGRAMVCW